MKCPDCGVELVSEAKLGQGVWRCPTCLYTWFILKIRKKSIHK
jgi:ribosomal protein L37AE/L43A